LLEDRVALVGFSSDPPTENFLVQMCSMFNTWTRKFVK
jgi:hypothetical protein